LASKPLFYSIQPLRELIRFNALQVDPDQVADARRFLCVDFIPAHFVDEPPEEFSRISGRP
jgi:hypothetical protein